MSHVRAHIRLTTQGEVMDLIHDLREFSDHEFSIENFSGTQRANAKSLLGVLYASGDYGDEMYLINDTVDGEFPVAIDRFRA